MNLLRILADARCLANPRLGIPELRRRFHRLLCSDHLIKPAPCAVPIPTTRLLSCGCCRNRSQRMHKRNGENNQNPNRKNGENLGRFSNQATRFAAICGYFFAAARDFQNPNRNSSARSPTDLACQKKIDPTDSPAGSTFCSYS